ncbi:MAG: multidrug efflux SMR transporter [Fibrobacteria bacterium]|nr:multidrug efflux SMR transporter [Fibrobacteria bacterium]
MILKISKLVITGKNNHIHPLFRRVFLNRANNITFPEKQEPRTKGCPMLWMMLFCAILMEVFAQTFLKMSAGWTKLVPGVIALILFPTQFVIYSLVINKLPISISYALWSGLGTAAMAFIGWLWFKETLTALNWFFISVIIVGIVGLLLSKQ